VIEKHWYMDYVPLLGSDKYKEQRRVWGGGIRGNKSADMLRKRAKAAGQTMTAAAAKKL
jgi:large subunit ribosomal protein L7Ae